MENKNSNSDIIDDTKYFILYDSKGVKKICHTGMGKAKFNKLDINLKKLIGKRMNSFWEYDPETKEFNTEITSQDFFKEDLSKFIFRGNNII